MLQNVLIQMFRDNSLQRWLAALAAAVAVIAALRILRYGIIHLHLRAAARGIVKQSHDLIVACAQRTGWLFQIAVGMAVARSIATIPEPWDGRWQAVVMVTVIVQFGFWANGVVDYLVLARLDQVNAGRDAAYKTGRNMLRSLGLVLVWAAVLLLAFENVGVHVTTLVAGLGVTGVAVAFATQNILSDLFASVSLLLDKPFLLGDFIVVDTFMGTVERIGVRTTRLLSLSGEALVFANSDLAKSRLRNFKRMTERRVVFTFSLSYETPEEQLACVGEWVRDVIAAQPKTRFDRAHWLSFSDTGLLFECVYYVLDSDYNVYMNTQQAINLGIVRALRAKRLELAYGTQLKVPTPLAITGGRPSHPANDNRAPD